MIAAVRLIAMAAHNAASALVAGEVLQRIRVYQDPCKALQRLVTKDRMRTPQVRQSDGERSFVKHLRSMEARHR